MFKYERKVKEHKHKWEKVKQKEVGERKKKGGKEENIKNNLK